MKPEDFLLSEPRDNAEVSMDVSSEMTRAAVAGMTFEQAMKTHDLIEDTPAFRRVYAVTLQNVTLMMANGIQVDIPYAI